MISKAFLKVNTLIINILDSKFKLNKSRKDFFIEVILLFLCIRGHINFLQMGRLSKFGEQRFRQHFEQTFGFMTFNKTLISENAGKKIIIGFDPSYVSKSGTKTYGTGYFWSGQAGQVKHGLEISGIAAIDLENHTAMHLEAVQTPDSKSLSDAKLTLLGWYAKLISDRATDLKSLSLYLAADAYFSKKLFVDAITAVGMFIVSRLRCDADIYYLYDGQPTGKRGRPRIYGDKINISALDESRFEKSVSKDSELMFSAVVYSKSLKRKIKLCIVELGGGAKKITRNLYFSTDLELSGAQVWEFYQNRFQIEFLFRDAKQFTGLTNCQARSENKLNFHFNASLTAVNVAKAAHWLSVDKNERTGFSMSDIKTVYHNDLLIQRFIDVFGINPNSTKNQKLVKELRMFGTIAA